MAVSVIEEIKTKMTMSENFEWTRTNVYRITTTSTVEDPEAIWDALRNFITDDPAKPAELLGKWVWGVGVDVKQDNNVMLVGVDLDVVDPANQPFTWTATVQWKDWAASKREEKKGQNATKSATGVLRRNADPANEEPQWEGDQVHSEEEEAIQTSEAPITNSADQPYPTDVVQRNYDIIPVRFNTATIDLGQRSLYMSQRGAINSDTFWGYPPGTLRIRGWQYQRRPWKYVEPVDAAAPNPTEGIQYYIENVIEVQIRMGDEISPGVYSGWGTRKPDLANASKGTGGTPSAIYKAFEFGLAETTDQRTPGTNLQLDGNGNLKPDQTANVTVRPTIQYFVARPFASLPLPASLPAGLTNSL